MNDQLERRCPECSERLSPGARRCACGWGQRKVEAGKAYDHRCTFKAGFDRCAYPIGLFAEGRTSGWCIFHRNSGGPSNGAEIVRQSASVPYHEALRSILVKTADNASVRALRAKIAVRGHGGVDAQRVGASLPAMRQPGEDEAIS